MKEKVFKVLILHGYVPFNNSPTIQLREKYNMLKPRETKSKFLLPTQSKVNKLVKDRMVSFIKKRKLLSISPFVYQD